MGESLAPIPGVQAQGTEGRFTTEGPDALRPAVQALRWLWRHEGAPEGILCIGTDRSTGDSLGPLVGSELHHRITSIPVWGVMERPVHAANLQILLKHHPDLNQRRVLAIDASLGKLNDVGSIVIGPGPLKPGAGVNKQLPPLGAYHLTGTVNVSGFMEYFVLQNTRLFLVMQMASFIAGAVTRSLSS